MIPEHYRRAILGDQLFMLCVAMFVVASVATAVCQSMFPSETDFRILTPLPVTRRAVFGAKLLALAVFTAVFVLRDKHRDRTCVSGRLGWSLGSGAIADANDSPHRGRPSGIHLRARKRAVGSRIYRGAGSTEVVTVSFYDRADGDRLRSDAVSAIHCACGVTRGANRKPRNLVVRDTTSLVSRIGTGASRDPRCVLLATYLHRVGSPCPLHDVDRRLLLDSVPPFRSDHAENGRDSIAHPCRVVARSKFDSQAASSRSRGRGVSGCRAPPQSAAPTRLPGNVGLRSRNRRT